MSRLSERAAEVVLPRVNRALEVGAQRLVFERMGFVRIEDEKQATELRVKTLEGFWALKGLGLLLELPHLIKALRNQRARGITEQIVQIKSAVTWGRMEDISDDNLRGVVQRMMAFSEGKELLGRNLEVALARGSGDKEMAEAASRLSMLVNITATGKEGRNGGKKAIILTQPADALKGAKIDPMYGFEDWVKFGIKLGGTAIPYEGAAVVYSELMMTGKFDEIEIADFNDEVAITRVVANRSGYDLVMISGANTGDTQYSLELGKRLSEAGLKVLHGGAVPSINDPGWYIGSGGSLFVGEFEGASDEIVQWLEGGGSQTVFVRGALTDKHLGHRARGIPYAVLSALPPHADLEQMYSVERERQGYLGYRLIALEMMRPMARFGDLVYEPPPLFQPQPTNTSYGCPNECEICTTVPTQGKKMRKRPVESVAQEWEAVKSPIIGILDQNFTANGRDYVVAILGEAMRLRKKVAFQSELTFFSRGKEKRFYFDGTEADGYRARLLQKAVAGIEVGLEMPVQIGGTLEGRKNPLDFIKPIRTLNKLGVILFGTVVIGMPKNLWAEGVGDLNDRAIVPYSDLDEAEWRAMIGNWVNWLNTLKIAGPVLLGFTPVYGTAAHGKLMNLGLLVDRMGVKASAEAMFGFDPRLLADQVKGIDTLRAIEDIRKQIYSTRRVVERLAGINYDWRRQGFMLMFNTLAGKAFRQKME